MLLEFSSHLLATQNLIFCGSFQIFSARQSATLSWLRHPENVNATAASATCASANVDAGFKALFDQQH